MFRKHKVTGFPTVITLFSAPNYLDAYGNKGAVLKYENNVMNIRQFNCVPHPYHLPNFLDVFSWSLPFVAEKITDLLLTILSLSDDLETEDEDTDAEEAQRRANIKAKVGAVAKWAKMYSVLRQENEAIVQLKNLTAGGKLPRGLLSAGAAAITEAVSSFDSAQQADKMNEKRPPVASE